MSEGDVSLIQDEDVLRRMWQQTEDFSRKKEIRAHMYRLREERLRNMYSPEPTIHKKGSEFTTVPDHVKSFANQNFQSMKSKEVRDAGSPPKDHTYRGQELKAYSNAGWNVESENKTTDDGHTHVKSIQANIEGTYDVDGGKGQFTAIDQHKQALTEYHDDNSTMKRNESVSNTAAHEQVVRNTQDGTHFSSTTSSSTSSSKVQQTSSTKQEIVPYELNDTMSRRTSTDISHDVKETRQTKTSNCEQILRNNEFIQGELVARKVEYPDDNTTVVVETRCLPDGTRVTNTRREYRTPVVQNSRSEKHSEETRTESKSSLVSQKLSDIRESSNIVCDTSESNTRSVVESQNFSQQRHVDSSDQKDHYVQVVTTDSETQKHNDDVLDQRDYITKKKNNDVKENIQTEYSIEDNKRISSSTAISQDVVERKTTSNQYQTTYQSDYTQKISNDWSPTQQAWASSLRGDSPSVTRVSTRASSPNSKTFQSSTSSLRSSISPDKTYKRSSSRETSPSKIDRYSPSRNISDRISNTHTLHTVTESRSNKYTSPERKPPQGYSLTKSSISPERRPQHKGNKPQDLPKKHTNPERNQAPVRSAYSPDKIIRNTSPNKYTSPDRNSLYGSSPTRLSASPERIPVNKDNRPIDLSFKSTSPDRKPSSITSDSKYFTRISSPTRPSSSPDRKDSPPKTNVSNNVLPSITSPHSPRCSPDKHTPITPTSKEEVIEHNLRRSSISPDKKSNYMRSTASSIAKEEHYKFIDEETKIYNSTHINKSTSDNGTVSTAISVSKSPEKDTPDHCYIELPSNTIKSSIKKDSRSPSPPKGYVTFTEESFAKSNTGNEIVRSDISVHHNDDTTEVKYVDINNISKETSPVNYGTYDKKTKRVLEDESLLEKSVDTELKYDLMTRRSSSPKKFVEPSMLPAKKHPRDSPIKSQININTNQRTTTNFISTEKNREEINMKTSKDHPRQLLTPSTSPTRRPKSEPSTGQSSPTTSVSGFVYFGSTRPESNMTTDLDDQECYSETITNDDISIKSVSTIRPDSRDMGRSPSPTKIPYRSPSPDSKGSTSVKESLPRKSSLKKISTNKQESPTEEPESSYRVAQPEVLDISYKHKIVKKDRADKQDIPETKFPLERRETYEERCRKILGMMKDEETREKVTLENKSIIKKSESNVTSPNVSPCRSPNRRESSPHNTNIKNKVTASETIVHEQQDKTQYHKISDIKIKTTRERSPTKLIDITSKNKSIVKEKKESSLKSASPPHKSSIEPSNDCESLMEHSKKTKSRTPSPVKKTADITDNNTQFIISEREQEILDRVQKSLRKLSPDRNERSPSHEKNISTSYTDTSEKDTYIATQENTISNNITKTTDKIDDDLPKSHNISRKPIPRLSSPTKNPTTIPKTGTSSNSPTKTRSASPKKSTLIIDRPNSPQIKKSPATKSKEPITNKVSPSAPSAKVDKTITTDFKKTSMITKQDSFTKTVNQKKSTNQTYTIKNIDLNLKKAPAFKRDNKLTQSLNSSKESDIKVTRTVSDSSIKSNKSFQQRVKSKPEIYLNVNANSKVNKKSPSTAKSTMKETYYKLSNKPKSATSLNTSVNENDNVIIDVQQAKSSRENSPDRICPTPINFIDDISTPRLPDEVNEPDDDFRKRTHHTIHETESIVDDIVEISEDDELFSKNENVNNSDECLLSVTEKVNKFTKGATDTKKNKITSQRIEDQYDQSTTYQDDYTQLSVNDKAHFFVETAENIKTPKVKQVQSIERPDLSNIDDDLKSDDCLLSVSAKVNKFVKTAEQFLTEAREVEEKDRKIKEQHEKFIKKNVDDTSTPSKDRMEKIEQTSSKLHKDSSGSFAKETASSQAKVKDYASPNLKTVDKSTPIKITTLRSSDAVKKAKALFENIATISQNSKDTSHEKITKLTDIGVLKKSEKTDSTIVLHPSVDDDSDFDREIDVQTDAGDKPTSKSSQQQPMDNRQRIITTKTILNRYPTIHKTDTKVEETYVNVAQSQDKLPGYLRPTKTSQIKEEIKSEEEIVSSRRGSGKFGVELRRTSLERSSVNNEHRKNSVEHNQPCIEDIYDLTLLEQMLDKVVGYEQRRRIRAQIRIVKKKMETEQISTNTFTKTTKHTILNTPKSVSPERQRKSSPQKTSSPSRYTTSNILKTTSPDRSQTKDEKTNTDFKEEGKNITEKPPRTRSPVKTNRPPLARQQSPEKKTRAPSPSKKYTAHTKSSRFDEYASAYMKKVGLSDSDKIKFTETKTKKTTPIDGTQQRTSKEEHSTVETTQHSSSTITRNINEKTSSRDVIENQTNCKRSHTPEKKHSPVRPSPHERLYQRSPSPDFKRQRPEAKKETIIKTSYEIAKKEQQKTDDKPSWVANRNLKKITSETRTFSSKKIENDKTKFRSTSPSKAITKPTDVIISSYGIGPLDANGKPLFGIKALRNGTNYQVKGTVVRQEFHSRNGGEPEGTVTVTAYSNKPEELEKLLQSQGERPSRIHGLAAITTTKKFGGNTGTTMTEIHSKEDRAALDEFTHSNRRMDSSIKTSETRRQEKTQTERTKTTEKKTVRQSSVKSLTEKYIKNTTDKSKTDRTLYPKAGLILRTTNMKDTASSDSSQHAGLGRTDSDQSLGSVEDMTSNQTYVTQTHKQHTNTQERSFLDSNTKVTGVQDILTRMKNADIVIEEGDTNEDTEARALLNKFLGATVLMAGMKSYVTEKPTEKVVVKQETVRSSGSGDTKVTSSTRSVQEIDLEQCWDERILRKLLEECTDYEQRRQLRARLRILMAEQEACATAVTDALTTANGERNVDGDASHEEERVTTVTSSVRRNSSEQTVSSSTTTKTSKVIETVSRPAPKVSPFAKFRQLEKQNSLNSPNSAKSPQSPGSPSQPYFKFTDPALQASAVTIKERLLQWCRDKTRDYENVKLENFSTSWADGLAFCALLHHFLPDAFDYSQLTPEKRRHNFTLAFKVADEKAGIYPLLDVDDMVAMRKPDWKCVFTYVQSIHRRFKDQR